MAGRERNPRHCPDDIYREGTRLRKQNAETHILTIGVGLQSPMTPVKNSHILKGNNVRLLSWGNVLHYNG